MNRPYELLVLSQALARALAAAPPDLARKVAQDALARLRASPVAVDAMGAPTQGPIVNDWDSLRRRVIALVRDYGVETVANRFGCEPDSLMSMVHRTAAPGAGRRARLELLVNRQN